MITILIVHVLCAFAGVWIATKAELTNPEIVGGLVGGLLNVLGLAILGGIWGYRYATGKLKGAK